MMVLEATTANMTSGVSAVFDLATECVNFMIGNPLCLIFLAGGLIGIGVKVFKKAKSLAK